MCKQSHGPKWLKAGSSSAWPRIRLDIAESRKTGPKIAKLEFLVSGVAPANQTKERSVHELFTGAFRNKSSM